MTDPAHLQAALERLHYSAALTCQMDGKEVACSAKVSCADLRLLLTDYAVLLARAEAAEARVRETAEAARYLLSAADDADEVFRFGISDCIDNNGRPYQSSHLDAALKRLSAAVNAAHPQPQAPVMGGEGLDA